MSVCPRCGWDAIAQTAKGSCGCAPCASCGRMVVGPDNGVQCVDCEIDQRPERREVLCGRTECLDAHELRAKCKPIDQRTSDPECPKKG